MSSTIKPGDVVCQHRYWTAGGRDGVSFYYGVVREAGSDSLLVEEPGGRRSWPLRAPGSLVRVVRPEGYSDRLRRHLGGLVPGVNA